MKVEFEDANKSAVYMDLGVNKMVLPFDMVVALNDRLSGMIAERRQMDEIKRKKLEVTKSQTAATTTVKESKK